MKEVLATVESLHKVLRDVPSHIKSDSFSLFAKRLGIPLSADYKFDKVLTKDFMCKFAWNMNNLPYKETRVIIEAFSVLNAHLASFPGLLCSYPREAIMGAISGYPIRDIEYFTSSYVGSPQYWNSIQGLNLPVGYAPSPKSIEVIKNASKVTKSAFTVESNEQRFLAVYYNPKADVKKRLVFIEPIFEAAGPALIALQSYRLEHCSAVIICGSIDAIVNFIGNIEENDVEGEVAKSGIAYLKDLAVGHGLNIYYHQDGGESPQKSDIVSAMQWTPFQVYESLVNVVKEVNELLPYGRFLQLFCEKDDDVPIVRMLLGPNDPFTAERVGSLAFFSTTRGMEWYMKQFGPTGFVPHQGMVYVTYYDDFTLSENPVGVFSLNSIPSWCKEIFRVLVETGFVDAPESQVVITTAGLKPPAGISNEGKMLWKQLVKNQEWKIRELSTSEKQQFLEHLYQWACKTAGVSPYSLENQDESLEHIQLLNDGFSTGEVVVRDAISDLKHLIKVPRGHVMKFKSSNVTTDKCIITFGVDAKYQDEKEAVYETNKVLMNLKGFNRLGKVYERFINRLAKVIVVMTDDSLNFLLEVEIPVDEASDKAAGQVGREWSRSGKLTKKLYKIL